MKNPFCGFLPFMLLSVVLAACGGGGSGGGGVAGQPKEVIDISGQWNYIDNGWIRYTEDGYSYDEYPSGSGTVTIYQNGSNISWTDPLLNELRSGTIDGSNLALSGKFVVPLVSGIVVNQNTYTVSGTYSYSTSSEGPTISNLSGSNSVDQGEAATFSWTGTPSTDTKSELIGMAGNGDASGSYLGMSWSVTGSDNLVLTREIAAAVETITRYDTWVDSGAPASNGTATTATVSTGNLTTGSHTFNVKAIQSDGLESTAASRAFTVTSPTATLISIAISGPTSVDENTTASYTVTATWSDGSTSTVTSATTWSVSPTTHASIGGGVLTAFEVAADRTVTVSASYTAGGVTRTASQYVTVINTGGTVPPGDYTLRFDGGDHVSVPDGASLSPSQITVETWVRVDRIVASGSAQMIIAKGNDQTQGSYYMIQNGNQFHFYIGRIYVDQVYAIADVPDLATNRWYHVAGTYDGTNLKIYLDGVLKGTTPGNVSIGNTASLTFGFHNLSGWPYYLQGDLDDIRIWGAARTESEIQAGMYQSLTGGEPGLAAYWSMNEGSGQVVNDATGNANDGQLGSTSGADANDPTWVIK